jgi:hypothetical protein
VSSPEIFVSEFVVSLFITTVERGIPVPIVSAIVPDIVPDCWATIVPVQTSASATTRNSPPVFRKLLPCIANLHTLQ